MGNQGGLRVTDEMTTEQQKEHEEKTPRSWRRLQTWFVRLNILYAVLFVGWLGLLEFEGESGILLSFALFLPAWGWCIPSLVLFPLCLLIKARIAPVHIVLIALVVFGYMGLQFNSASDTPGGLTIISYNYGQRGRTDIMAFVAKCRPDLIALQDAPKRTGKYRQIYPNMNFAEVGEFLLMSRHPLGDSRAVVIDPSTGTCIAARHEVEYDGRRIAVYNIHLPTPRREVARLRSHRLFGLLPSRKILNSQARWRYRDFLDNKRALLRDLLLELEQEKLPYLVVGDLNTPPNGAIYRPIAAVCQDAFKERGYGFGFTFPGNVKRIYSFQQPWLRLDYVFRSEQWQTEEFITEQDRLSQHRAVAARLKLKD